MNSNTNFVFFTLLAFFIPFSGLVAQKNDDSTIARQYFQKARVHFTTPEKGASAQYYLQRFTPRSNASRIMDFQLHKINERKTSTTYSFLQIINGIPVLDASAKVDIPKNGEASVVVNENFSHVNDARISSLFPGANAYYWSDPETLISVIKLERLNDTGNVVLELFDEHGNMVMRRMNGSGSGPATAVATVFNPNPVTSAETVYGAPYTDNNDDFNQALNAELDTVTLDLTYDSTDSLYKLINKHVIITEHSPPTIPVTTSENDTFFFVRSEPEFEDVNAFYHITEYWKYLRQIGYEVDIEDSVEVDANGFFGQDLSSFNSLDGALRLTFGTGGVDDAEDADVIIHEYGHAISYSLAPGSNQGIQRQSIDEGFCDYLAASYSRNINPHDYRKVFSWDGHNEFWDGRVAWSNRFYPDQLENRIYTDAPMWSGALVHVENNVGRDLTHQLVLESMYSYVAFMDMEQAARLILRADTLINGGDRIEYLAHIFAERGFIEMPAFAPPGDLVGVEDVKKRAVETGWVQMINSAGFSAGNSPVIFRVDGENRPKALRIFAVGGRQVFEKRCSGARECNLSPRNINSGLYIIIVELVDGSREVFKVIVL